MAPGDHHRTIEVDHEVDLRATARFAKNSSIDDGLWWPTTTPDGPATLRLRGSGQRISATAWGPGASWVLAQTPALLGTLDDPSAFAPSEEPLRSLSRRRVVRFGRTDRVFEALLPAILGQKVQTIMARRSLRGLVRTYGEQAPGPRPELRLMPTAERLGTLGYADLHRFDVERKRAQTIIEAARRANRIEEVSTMNSEDAHRRLCAVRGVGIWTAAVALGTACGDADAVAVGDFHIKNHVAWALAGEERGTDERMLELLEPYRGHRGRVVRMIKGGGLTAPKRGPKLSLQPIADL